MAKKRDGNELERIEEALDVEQYALAGELTAKYSKKYPDDLDDLDGLWFRGLSLYCLDRCNEAKTLLTAALPRFSEEFLGGVMACLARIHRDAGCYAEAERLYGQAIDASPQDSELYVELGELLMSVDRFAEAEEIAKKGILAEASVIEDLHFFLGTLYRAQGEIARAYHSFQVVLAGYENEEATAALIDLEQAARVRAIKLPKFKPLADDESDTEDEGNHIPGELAANIQRELFVDILSGKKKVDYRPMTDSWRTRIEDAGCPPFHFRIINGLSKDAPELTIVCEKVLGNLWGEEYELHLGEIIDVKNWDAENPGEEIEA
jgi:tetratricopeptide (TPR) repeat protein